ncbi:MAG: hypothetical protein Rhims3KO_20600 [Hyphomicrobiales bacterium]
MALLASASAIPSLGFVSASLAQCAPDAVANTAVICDADDADGYDLPAGDLTSFHVQSGTFIVGPGTATINVDGTVGTFENHGQIAGLLAIQDAVRLGGIGPGGFFNSGTIGSVNNAGIFVDGNVTGLFVNAVTGLISGESGLYAVGSIASVENQGNIEGGLIGIGSDDTIGSITNSGLISAAVGIGAQNDIGSVSNWGLIEGAVAILTDGTVELITNAGEIFGADNGIEALNIGTLINFGLIDSYGDGIDVDGGGGITNNPTSIIGSLINHGLIRGDDDGVDVGTLTRLVNTGTIFGGFSGGTDTSGIAASVITEIINSGTIRTGGDINVEHAIEERLAGDTSLTLNAGSILIGRVDLGGGVNTLSIGAGHSLNSRFDSDDGAATLPVLGTLAGHLVAFDGSATQRQIVAVDLSAFVSFDDALAALTSGSGGAVQSRQSALRSETTSGFSAGDEAGAQQFDPNRFWIEGFGAYRQQQSERTGSDFDHLTGGLVAGVDAPLDALSSVGVMAGFAASTSENEINTQETNATSYFAGIYGSTQAMGLAWDASLTVGYTDYEAERITANNLVANGLETARADFSGWFINPQVTMTREAANPLGGRTFHGFSASPALEQSLTLSYAGLFLDGYTETGTTNPLTLDDRSVHLASARAALALPFEAVHADGAITTLRLIGGVEARTQFGEDTISGTLLGQAVSTTLDNDAFTGGAFLGLAGEYETTSGLTAYANLEAMLETNMSYQLSATAGLRITF